MAVHGKTYSAVVSAFPLSPRRITFELPSQLEVDDPEQRQQHRFDDTLLVNDGMSSFALYHVRDGIYRVRANQQIPFDFSARLASQADGPDYQATVINNPAPGWVDVELAEIDQRFSYPPSSSIPPPPAQSGVRPLSELITHVTRTGND